MRQSVLFRCAVPKKTDDSKRRQEVKINVIINRISLPHVHVRAHGLCSLTYTTAVLSILNVVSHRPGLRSWVRNANIIIVLLASVPSPHGLLPPRLSYVTPSKLCSLGSGSVVQSLTWPLTADQSSRATCRDNLFIPTRQKKRECVR